jgi:hypothetical protein
LNRWHEFAHDPISETRGLFANGHRSALSRLFPEGCRRRW